jgi:hypothetical protein
MVAEKFPRLEARFIPADAGARAQVLFRGGFPAGAASGTWSCSGGGSTGSGNWNAQRQ